jgi:hypothetical protein
MRTETNLMGYLATDSMQIDNVVISVATPDAGRMQTRDGFKVGDRFHFEGIDGREADIEISRIDPPNTFFAFLNALEKAPVSCKTARPHKR